MVVATFGEFDEDAVEAGVRLGLPYVGLVASARRAGSVLLSELRDAGSRGRSLSVVRSPAGLPIGASGQEGISLSIMAEIFSLRAKLRPPTTDERPTPRPQTRSAGCTVEIQTARHTSEHGGESYYFCGPGCKRSSRRSRRSTRPPISA